MYSAMSGFWKCAKSCLSTGAEYVKSHPMTTISIAIALLQMIIEDVWIFTKVPLPGDPTSNPLGKSGFTTLKGLGIVLSDGVTGLAIDYARKHYYENNIRQENADEWDNLLTWFALSGAILKCLTNYLYLVSSMPLPGQVNSDELTKSIYGITALVASAIKGGMNGALAYYVRQNYNNKSTELNIVNEKSPLLTV